MSVGNQFASGAVLMSSFFLLGWMYARKINNYSWVDAFWAFGIGITAIFWLALGDWSMKHGVAAGMVGIWSLRLGGHLQKRIRKHHPNEDTRYAKLREIWKENVASRFFWFFQAQALSVIILAIPFFFIARDSDASWSLWETVGLIFWVTGILGESIADAQMTTFKHKNHSSDAVCKSGLWYYSRHPNYFFEAVIWTGFYFYACGSTWGWATIHAPALITYLLLFVTGIPPTEASAVLRKGDAYRRYQKSTSPFVPWFPKKS